MRHLVADVSRRCGIHKYYGIAAHLPHLVCINNRVIGAGSPHAVLTPSILERTYGARMEVLIHGGMPVVVDGMHRHHHGTGPHEHRSTAPLDEAGRR